MLSAVTLPSSHWPPSRSAQPNRYTRQCTQVKINVIFVSSGPTSLHLPHVSLTGPGKMSRMPRSVVSTKSTGWDKEMGNIGTVERRYWKATTSQFATKVMKTGYRMGACMLSIRDLRSPIAAVIYIYAFHFRCFVFASLAPFTLPWCGLVSASFWH